MTFFQNRTFRIWTAIFVCLAVLFFFDRLPASLRWPTRLLVVMAVVWLALELVRAVRRTVFSAKKAVFSLILGLMFYGVVHLMCHMFVKIMGARDRQLIAAETLELIDKQRKGIRAMLDGNSPVKYDRKAGWVHRPGFQWSGHSITKQGFRGTRLYSKVPVDPDRRIICLGDSFTFGYEVADDQSFPACGEQSRPGTEWINLGVCGGDLTQALHLYRSQGRKYGGKYVVIGFMSDNHPRTVNCFRAFLTDGSMTPLTKPFAKFANDTFSIQPNPYQKITAYEKLLANERQELKHLHKLDYPAWSNQHSPTNPVSRTWHYALDRMEIRSQLAAFLNQSDKDGPPWPSAHEDPYGDSIWHSRSLAFMATTGLFDKFHSEIVSDGRIPLIVFLPARRDLEYGAKGRTPLYGAMLDRLRLKGYDCIDFLDSLGRRHPGTLDPERFYIKVHFNAETNKYLAAEIIKALKL